MSQSADDNTVRAGLEEVSDLLRAGDYADAEKRLSDLVERTGDDQLSNALEVIRNGDVDPDRVAAELEELAEHVASAPSNDAESESPFEMFEEFSGDEFDESLSEGLEALSEMDEDSNASFEGGEQAPTRVAGSLDDIAGGPGGIVAEDEEEDDDESDSPMGGTRMGAPQPTGESDDDASGLSELMEQFGGGDDEEDAGVGDEETGGTARESGSTQQGAGFDPGSEDHTTAPRQEAPDPDALSDAGESVEARNSTMNGEPGLEPDSSAPSMGNTNATQRGAPGLKSEGGGTGGDQETGPQEDGDDEFDIDLGLDNPGQDDSAGVDLDVEDDAESDNTGDSAEQQDAGVAVGGERDRRLKEQTGTLGEESSDHEPTSEVEAVDSSGFEETDASSQEEAKDEAVAALGDDDGDDGAIDLNIDWGEEDDDIGRESTGLSEESEARETEENPQTSPDDSEGPRYDVESSRADALADSQTGGSVQESQSSDRETQEGQQQGFDNQRESQRQTAPGSGLSVPKEMTDEESEPVDEDRFMELADSISDAQKQKGDQREGADQRQPAQSGDPEDDVHRADTQKMSSDATDSNEATQAPFMREGGGSDLYAEGFQQESETSSGSSDGPSSVGEKSGADSKDDSSSGAVRLLNEARRLFEDGHLESAHDLAQSILEQSGGHQGAENLLYEIRQKQRKIQNSKETAEGEDSPTPRSVEAVDPSNPPPEAIPPEDLEPADDEVSTVEGDDPMAQSSGQPAGSGVVSGDDGDAVGDEDIRDMTKVPVQAVDMDELAQRDLDHRYGFVFSMIDGQMTFEDIVDVCSMPREETLDVLEGLKARSLIHVE